MAEGTGDPLHGAAPEYDDVEAKRARAGVAASLFSAEVEEAEPILVGRYRVESRLGAGGMGVVYRAHDPELDRPVAVKLLHADAADDDRARARMQREARSLAKLSHPNVITVYDVGVEDDQVFVAMELVAGKDLRRWLEAVKAEDWRRVLSVFLDAGRGLEAAHAVGLVHRDFKPENVLVGHDGRVRVLDFGLARARTPMGVASEVEEGPLPHDLGSTGPTDSAGAAVGAKTGELEITDDEGLGRLPTQALTGQLTETGALIGTPLYMAPELYAGDAAGPASDQFAFCASLYEAIYRSRPFGEDTMTAHVEAVREGRLVAPGRGGAAPIELWQLIARGLHADPRARYPNVSSLLADIEELLRDPAGVSLPNQSMGGAGASPSQRWSWFIAGGAVLGLVGTLIAVRMGMLSTQSGADARGAQAANSTAAEGSPEETREAAEATQPGTDPETEPETGGEVPGATTGEGEAGSVGAETGAEVGTETGTSDALGQTSAGEGESGEVGEAPAVSATADAHAGHGWCHLHEDRYTLLARTSKRRGHLKSKGECFACRTERRRSRTRNFSPRDCTGYSLCGPTAAEECK